MGSRFGPYALCGWKVFSDIALPELSPWSTAVPEERALSIELGRIRHHGPSVDFAVTDEEEIVIRIPDVAAFHIAAAGDRVTVQVETNADPVLLRNMLYGSVLAALCYKRGLLPLHGASVLIDQAAVIFSGPSGVGKSTLATALARRGYPLLCDDVCAIDMQVASRPVLWPAFPRIKLRDDAISKFQLGTAVVYSRAASGTKGHFGIASLPSSVVIHPVSITAIYALDPSSGDKLECTLLPGKDAFAFLDSQAHRGWMTRNLGVHGDLFRQVAALASAIPVYRLQRPCDFERLGEIAELVGAAQHNRAVLSAAGLQL